MYRNISSPYSHNGLRMDASLTRMVRVCVAGKCPPSFLLPYFPLEYLLPLIMQENTFLWIVLLTTLIQDKKDLIPSLLWYFPIVGMDLYYLYVLCWFFLKSFYLTRWYGFDIVYVERRFIMKKIICGKCGSDNTYLKYIRGILKSFTWILVCQNCRYELINYKR